MLKLNRKASFEISSQSIFWFPRVLFMIIFIIVVTSPIGCYSKNQQEQIKAINLQKAEISILNLKNCLEKFNLDQAKVESCISNHLGAVINTNEKSFVINQEIYSEKNFCDLSKKYTCSKEIAFLKINNELTKVNLDAVVINE